MHPPDTITKHPTLGKIHPTLECRTFLRRKKKQGSLIDNRPSTQFFPSKNGWNNIIFYLFSICINIFLFIIFLLDPTLIMTHAMWHVTRDSQGVVSIVLKILRKSITDLINESVTKLFSKQPQLHRVFKKTIFKRFILWLFNGI